MKLVTETTQVSTPFNFRVKVSLGSDVKFELCCRRGICPDRTALVEFMMSDCTWTQSGLILILVNSYMYTETKKFSNTSQIRIFITELHAEINTNLIIFLLQKM